MKNTKPKNQIKYRSIYFATHFDVCYTRWTSEQWEEYLKELINWGMNFLWVWFDWRDYHSPYNGDIEDYPDEKKQWQRLKDLYSLARKLNLKTGLLFIPNEGFRGQAEDDIRTQPMQFFTGDKSDSELCPSTLKGRELILENRELFLKSFERIDFIGINPLDPGGCGCEKCSPWLTKGFLDISNDISKLSKTIHPSTKILLTNPYTKKNENRIIIDFINRNDHIDGFVDMWEQWTSPHLIHSPVVAREHMQELASLLNPEKSFWIFPDLSMTFSTRKSGGRTMDWGQTGANPFPERFNDLLRCTDRIEGIIPYSEGIFEDINKVTILASAENMSLNTKTALKRYAETYFPTIPAMEFIDIINSLEKHPAHDPKFHDVLSILEKVESISNSKPELNNNWRWQILRQRVIIDAGVVNNDRSMIVSAATKLRKLYKEPETRIPSLDGNDIADRLFTGLPSDVNEDHEFLNSNT